MKICIKTLINILILSIFTLKASYATENPIQKVIIGNDDRVLQKDTMKLPNNSIASLKVYFGKSSNYCTGTLIENKKIITAGHCLYKNSTNTKASKVEISIAQNAGNLPYGKVTSYEFSINKGYYLDKNKEFDIGIIKLNELQSNNLVNFNKINILSADENNIGKRVEIIGYPGDKISSFGITQWKSEGNIISENQNYFTYDIDTYLGQSGSPVFDEDNEVVGVHVMGDYGENGAIKINENIFKWIQNY